MRRLYLFALCLTALLVGIFPKDVCAQGYTSDNQVQKNSFPIYFRLGSAEIDLDYMDNGKSVEKILDMIRNTDIVINKVEMMATTSPEGSVELNTQLAEDRSEAFYKYFKRRIIGIRERVVSSTMLYSWSDLADMIAGDLSIHDIEIVQSILRTENEGSMIEKLKSIDNGVTYKYLDEVYLAKMRSSGCVVIYFTPVRQQPGRDTIYSKDTVVFVVKQECKEEEPEPVEELPFRYPVIAFRTNLLVPLTNIGVEVPIGNRFSVSGDFYSPWHPRLENHKNCVQAQAFNADVKYWFGDNHANGQDNKPHRLIGHAIGLFTSDGQYDFEYNFHGYQGEFMEAGLEYTYAIAGKDNLFRWQFTLGIGYAYSQKYEYDVYVEGGYLYTRRSQKNIKHFVGPIKAEVMFTFPIMSHKQKKEESR